jgi:hypothetical protein
MEDFVKVVGTLFLVVVLFAGFALLAAWPTMWMVNYLLSPSLLVSVFGIPALTFWKAFWLNFLTATLFKSAHNSGSKQK